MLDINVSIIEKLLPYIPIDQLKPLHFMRLFNEIYWVAMLCLTLILLEVNFYCNLIIFYFNKKFTSVKTALWEQNSRVNE